MADDQARLGSATSRIPMGPGDSIDRPVAFLSRVGIFQLLPPLVLADVARLLRPLDVAAGQVIVREGDPGDALYLIEAGTLTVETEVREVPQRTLARLGPREFFGEMALVSGEPRSATVRAETAGRLWRIDVADFQQLLAAQPALASAVAEVVTLRRETTAEGEYGVDHTNLFDLVGDRSAVRIGRADDNDLVLGSRLVSRHHAMVRAVGDGFELVDLGSTYCTFVNGAPVRKIQLKDGDQVWFADQRMLFDRRSFKRVTEPAGIRIDAVGVRKEVGSGKNLLHDISFTVLPGEFVAIVGGSGAGKSTLMDTLSGVRPATGGEVLYNGFDFYAQRDLYRTALGYVPQDDIIHRDLPVRVTLDFAAKLRLPKDTTAAERRAAVDQSLEDLGMTVHADTRVSGLSGGQRKRASIGVELLTRPRVFFLDEPTSGLDPATDAQMMALLGGLAHAGSTVVLTTHATKNVVACDKIVFLARGGHLAFVGSPARALGYFGVDAFDEIYVKLEEEASPEEWASRFRASPEYAQMQAEQQTKAGSAFEVSSTAPGAGFTPGRPPRGPKVWWRQFRVLSRRTTELYVRNPGRVVPLFAQPVGFGMLMILLFRSGVFDPPGDNPMSAIQSLWMLSLTTFLFGLLFGVQEIVKEFAIVRRERLVGVSPFPYLMSKMTFLVPVLMLVAGIMVAILAAGNRLPDLSAAGYSRLVLTLVLLAVCALAIGLFTSAAVKSSQTATDLLVAWIMPQALFSGMVIPVAEMNTAAAAISTIIPLRWAFQGLGDVVGLPELLSASAFPFAPLLAEQYADVFGRPMVQNWLVLAGMTGAFLVLAWFVLRRRSTAR